MCYKIVHRLVNVPFDQFFKLTQHNSTRGHSLKLFYPDSRKSTRAHFFLCSCYLNMESPTCCSGPGKKFVCIQVYASNFWFFIYFTWEVI